MNNEEPASTHFAPSQAPRFDPAVGWPGSAQVSQLLKHPIFEHPQFQQLRILLRDPKVLATIIGLWVFILAFACRPRRTIKGATRRGSPRILLVGPSDGGKTSIFAKLAQEERPFTHTTLMPSIATVSIDGSRKPVQLMDLAGHARLRDEAGKHVGEADALVFVIDIVSLVRSAASVAEDLAPVLTSMASAAAQRGPSATPSKLLILAHKADLLQPGLSSSSDLTPSSRSTAAERMRSVLTREMDRLKTARGAGSVGGRIEGMSRVASSGSGFWARLFGGSAAEPDASAEDDEALVWGGAGPFQWQDVDGIEVSWGVSSVGAANSVHQDAVAPDNGLADLEDFLLNM